MKLNKILKTIFIICVVVIVIVAIEHKNKSASNVNVTTESIAKWKEKAPQLFGNEFNKVIVSGAISNKHTATSQDDLAGIITNPLGIRDDILDYIISVAPKDNLLASRAIIRIAQINQQIYYGNVTQKEALKLMNHVFLTEICLSQYLQEHQEDIIINEIDKLMRNTKSRDKHMWQIDTDVFGWQIIGAGTLTVAEIEEICKGGKF